MLKIFFIILKFFLQICSKNGRRTKTFFFFRSNTHTKINIRSFEEVQKYHSAIHIYLTPNKNRWQQKNQKVLVFEQHMS